MLECTNYLHAVSKNAYSASYHKACDGMPNLADCVHAKLLATCSAWQVCQGAESAMASLITLMAVADILGNNTAAVASYSKRLVLTALMGEPWGYMGSKRLLWEMYNRADTTTGLDVENVQQASLSRLCSVKTSSIRAPECQPSRDASRCFRSSVLP